MLHVCSLNSTPAFDVNSMLLSTGGAVSASQLRTTVIPPSDPRSAPPAPRFRSASRRMQKQLQSRASWKCVALLLVCFTAFLVAVISYLIGKYSLYHSTLGASCALCCHISNNNCQIVIYQNVIEHSSTRLVSIGHSGLVQADKLTAVIWKLRLEYEYQELSNKCTEFTCYKTRQLTE